MFSKLISTNTDVKTDEKKRKYIKAWSYRHGRSRSKSVLNATANWRIKTIDQRHKVSTPCLDDHQVTPEDLETVGELSECLIPRSDLQFACSWQELEDQIYVWTVNYLARPVTKWNRACDLRLARLISYMQSHNQLQTVLRHSKSSSRVQTGNFPRRRFCRIFNRLESQLQVVFCANLDHVRLCRLS